MPSGYPGTIDDYNDPTATDNLSTPAVLHHTQHTNVNDAIKAIETELGIHPSGDEATVAARLGSLELALAGKLDSSAYHAAFGVATLDASAKLVEEVDAAKLTSGTVPLARIPNLSGAKILGTGSGGAAIPLDAVPSLPASKTNSGIFDAARIPGLDGSKITTGTVPAARLPTSVTANANVNVKADTAERDTIPLVDRANGMLVWVRNPGQMYMWNTTTSTWDEVPGGDEKPERWRWATATYTGVANGAYSTVWSWTVKAGRAYAFDGILYSLNPGSSSPGLNTGFSWTGTGTFSASRQGVHAGVNAPAFVGDLNAYAVIADAASPLNDPSGLSTPAGIPLMVHVAGTYLCTADGTVDFRIAQAAANASFPPQLGIGSRMSCKRMVQ